MLQKLKKNRCRLLEWGTHDLMLPIIRTLKHLPEFPYTAADLRKMPSGSLGKELLHFLEGRQLHLLKGYESHDIKHTLLGYGPTEDGEAAMQYFFLGNGQRSFPVIITVAVTLIIMPEYYGIFRRAYKRGKATPSLNGVQWFDLLPYQTTHILADLKIAE